jgi:hypothetical protein
VPYADASAGHTFTLEEQSHYIHVLITAARQELAVQRGEACMTYLFLASDFQNGQHSAELCRVLYDYFVFENTFDNALEVADRLRDHAETDEEHLESAALQLRCLYQSNPTRAIAKLLDTASCSKGTPVFGGYVVRICCTVHLSAYFRVRPCSLWLSHSILPGNSVLRRKLRLC